MLLFSVESRKVTFAAGRKRRAILATSPLTPAAGFYSVQVLCSAGSSLQALWDCDARAPYPH